MLQVDRYLGSGRMICRAKTSLVVALEDGTQVHATMALTFPYQPAVSDELLVIGDAHAFYVIGVLKARGRSHLSNPEGVTLQAESGRLRLVGDRGIKLTGSRVHFEAQRLRRLAVTAVQTFGEQQTHVREALKVDAGEVDENSQNRWVLQARHVVLKALTGARIKSTTVRLG